MRRLSKAPKINPDTVQGSPFINDWFQDVTNRLNVLSGPNDPTVAEVAMNQWVVYRNTTSNEIRIWTNIAGVMKKSAAFT